MAGSFQLVKPKILPPLESEFRPSSLANRVLQAEFPELAVRIQVQLPSEKSQRVGQAIAAASLPDVDEV